MDNIKILVIDDDATTCGLLETILQLEDFQTASTNSVEDGDIVAILRREKPQALILDFYLGSQETLPYLQAIRADTEWQHLPIIMTSAINHRQECLDTGANDFILKPFNWQEVAKMVKSLSSDQE